MIIARSPLRLSLGGGGTDLPSYYENHGGYTLSLAINKYVYVSVSRPFFKGINLKYSKYETVSNVMEIEHPIIREALTYFASDEKQLEITSFADVPAGTGLGSSGSFTTALLLALSEHYEKPMAKDQLAELACEIEINKLSQPIGKQDQYIATYGGLTEFYYESGGEVRVLPVSMTLSESQELQGSLQLYFTGSTRSANVLLQEQTNATLDTESGMVKKLDDIKSIGFSVTKAISSGDIKMLGSLMNQHWNSKIKRSENISTSKIDSLYKFGMENGALGGKLVGAGGGGFLLFVTNEKERLGRAMKSEHLEELEFSFDYLGAKILDSQNFNASGN
jgi:D-glycero-alpha-D-manno-heptose-7-phosphate kinase